MKWLFWGFFFIYLSFELNVNRHSLNILPDFVGYLLLLRGTELLDRESRDFSRVRPFAVGMAVYAAVLWVGQLLGVTADTDWIARALRIVSLVVSLYVSRLLVRGVQEMEGRRGAELNGKMLLACWKGLAAAEIAGVAVGWMVNLANWSVLAAASVVLALARLVLIVLCLAAWSKSAAAYGRLPSQAAGPEPDWAEL